MVKLECLALKMMKKGSFAIQIPGNEIKKKSIAE